MKVGAKVVNYFYVLRFCIAFTRKIINIPSSTVSSSSHL